MAVGTACDGAHDPVIVGSRPVECNLVLWGLIVDGSGTVHGGFRVCILESMELAGSEEIHGRVAVLVVDMNTHFCNFRSDGGRLVASLVKDSLQVEYFLDKS